jgi:hypothetical protein
MCTNKCNLYQRKVTEILVKDLRNLYTCPNCNKQVKPQGITGHVKACAKEWRKKKKIKLKL